MSHPHPNPHPHAAQPLAQHHGQLHFDCHPFKPHPTPPVAVPPTPFAADVAKNVQGDVILGLQKRVEAFVFFGIAEAAAFRHILKGTLADKISSTGDVQAAQAQIHAARAHGGRTWLPIVHRNIAFSATGLAKLGINVATDLPGATAFAGGQELDATANLADPQSNGKVTTWKDVFLGRKIDGVIIVTAPQQYALDAEVAALKLLLGGTVAIIVRVDGVVRPGAEDGHEHFGFQDGISVPTIIGFNDASRTPGTDAVDPSVILTGQDDTSAAWIKDGSFLVFRELAQLVPEFNTFLESVAASFQPTVPGSAPVVLSPVQDDPILAKDPQRNMNFDYTTDLGQVACPYAAHIRKTNPRKGTAPANIPVQPHLIIRQGIPFGPEVNVHERDAKQTTNERGLLFACYQSSIEQGFQFVQKLWANNPQFPFGNTAGIVAPGEDLVIGQVTQGGRTIQGIKPNDAADPANVVQSPQPFVIPKGGEYFFVPSIDALRTKLGA